MLKTASWLLTAGACLAFAAAPALAADMPATKPAAAATAKPAAAAPMKPHHVWSCYDYAWESQAMKDCLAKPASAMPMKPMMHHHMMHHHMMHHMAPKPMAPPADNKS